METKLPEYETQQSKQVAPRFFGNGINGNKKIHIEPKELATTPRFFGNGINGNTLCPDCL